MEGGKIRKKRKKERQNERNIRNGKKKERIKKVNVCQFSWSYLVERVRGANVNCT